MRTIIVATDFSEAALNAAYYAGGMANAIHADILLLHVYQLSDLYPEMNVLPVEQNLINDTEKSMSKLKAEMMEVTKGKINIETKIITGTFLYELEEICKKIKPYTVIMGSQGTTAAEHAIFGSQTVQAMKNLKWPLITVPINAAFSQVKKICLACDYDQVIETIPIDEIKRLVNDFNAELHVIYSGKEEVPQPELVFESGMLQEMLLALNPKYHFVVNENAEEGVINFVEQNNIDMLITLPKKRVLLDKILHKSFSKKLILHSYAPVLTLHPVPEE